MKTTKIVGWGLLTVTAVTIGLSLFKKKKEDTFSKEKGEKDNPLERDPNGMPIMPKK